MFHWALLTLWSHHTLPSSVCTQLTFCFGVLSLLEGPLNPLGLFLPLGKGLNSTSHLRSVKNRSSLPLHYSGHHL